MVPWVISSGAACSGFTWSAHVYMGFPLQYPYMLKFVVFYLTWAPFWVSPYATEPGQKEVHKKKDEAEGFEDENVVSLFFILFEEDLR